MLTDKSAAKNLPNKLTGKDDGTAVGTTEGTRVGRALKVGTGDGATDVGFGEGATDGVDGDSEGPVGNRVYRTVGFLVGADVG